MNAGYAFDASTSANTIGTTAFQTLVPSLAPSSLSVGNDGFVGGAQAGYNWQAGSLVFGLETDIQYIDSSGGSSFTGAAFVIPGTNVTSTLTTRADSKIDYLGTLRGRIGVSFGSGLLYATGGLAYGGTKLTGGVVADALPVASWRGSSSSTSVGWTLGGGFEYMLNRNFSVKAEYLYYDLGDETVTALGNGVVRSVSQLNGIDYVAKADFTGSIVRVGLNYRFGGSSAPVIARY
ncbi:MAG: outer membrane beta-barrel protein [Beijerinckiaceae bacterium]|nr:outer membrane beta-barrel protein [Beijerinckiaceae bacterium]